MVSSGIAYGAVTTVYPTGVNPTDVQNVQAAVNQGGNILLKAVNKSGQPTAFNFGTWADNGTVPANSSVTLTAAVAITGEQVGSNRTTISGGVSPFYESDNGYKVSITGLKFVNPRYDAITIWRSAGITIVNNEVAGVLPLTDGSGEFTTEMGIFVGGAGNATVTGPVNIYGNYVHGLTGAGEEHGIYAYTVESPITIDANTVEVGFATTAGDGVVDSEGIEVDGSTGASVIADNTILVGPGFTYYGIKIQGPQTGAATILGNEIAINPAADSYAGIYIEGSNGGVQVLANYIDSGSESADGIYLEGSTNYWGTVSGATVALNDIDVASDMSAVELAGSVTKSSISLNLISGSSAYGVSALTDYNLSDLISSNYFLSNLFLGYSASTATFYFDTTTQNNVVRGPYATALNYGTGNSISH
jgi:hypothetical protein